MLKIRLDILRFIREYSRIQGYPPSLREISSLTGKSPSTVRYHLHWMTSGQQSLVSWKPIRSRTLTLTDRAHHILDEEDEKAEGKPPERVSRNGV